LDEEIARARRYDGNVGLIFGDMDNFSTLNSQLGYQLGDESLRRIATEVFATEGELRSRGSDVAARYGGQQFAILLPETDKTGATVRAERLRHAVSEVSLPGDKNLTISFGVAAFPGDANDSGELIKCARAALRHAKKDGKDEVIAFGEETTAERGNKEDIEERGSTTSRTVLGSGPPMFPSYHQRIAEIISTLESDQAVSALYVDLSRLRRIEQEVGLARHAQIFAKAGTILHSLQGHKLRRDDIICRTEVDDAYVCFLSSARHKRSSSPLNLETIARRVEATLDAGLADDMRQLGTDRPRITVGFARVLNNPLMRAERLIAKLIEEARASAAMLRERTIHRDKASLQELILNGRLTSVYQPIVHLASGAIFAFESLTRGPMESHLHSPATLFSVADEVDLTFELDRACFRGALRNAKGLEPIHRVFVNVLPLSFYDSSFIENDVIRLLEQANLTPANLVFEITERLAIENFSSFRRALARYTAMGFGVAIDDVGTRHSNLETVMALRPHFVKVSDILTHGISKSTVKREMLRSLGRIAEAIDAVIVAEGIETADDLAVVCDLGVRYGQGFFLARPGAPFPSLDASVSNATRALASGLTIPIPAPNIAHDEEGDVLEGEDDSTVTEAVLQRARKSQMMNSADDVIDELHKRVKGESASVRAARDTIVREREESYDDDGGPDTGMHKIDSQNVEWQPISVEDLGGGVKEESSMALLDSLRNQSESDPAEESEETTQPGRR
jgi:diguanylate cyclase (GGDEF)-like protein